MAGAGEGFPVGIGAVDEVEEGEVGDADSKLVDGGEGMRD